MIMRAGLCISLAVAVASFVIIEARAHHSFARFDYDKMLTLEGTVKEFQFTNPHSWIHLMVGDGAAQVEWAVEGGSVNNMVRTGWKKTTLAPGDTITLTLRPTRDGTKEGSLVGISKINGQDVSLGDGRLSDKPAE
jgi:hypothetical protein